MCVHDGRSNELKISLTSSALMEEKKYSTIKVRVLGIHTDIRTNRRELFLTFSHDEVEILNSIIECEVTCKRTGIGMPMPAGSPVLDMNSCPRACVYLASVGDWTGGTDE